MTSPDSDNPPTAKPSLWQRFRNYILLPELTPERIALSFAIGLSISWNPILGTQTCIALACCFFIKGIHRPMLFLSSFFNNPWTLVPIASASVFLGNLLLGRGWKIDISGISWKSIGITSFTSSQGFADMFVMLKPILWPYLLGGFTFCLLSLPLGYWFMLWLSRKLRKKPLHGAAGKS
ncbi:MAG: DUF2062 domain-containing protein [Holophagales bacterium]|jgi:uncharacterized protein (DUF2062 family)|nr:DUF2062 domain-containing protein [Holophagales bacterium]